MHTRCTRDWDSSTGLCGCENEDQDAAMQQWTRCDVQDLPDPHNLSRRVPSVSEHGSEQVRMRSRRRAPAPTVHEQRRRVSEGEGEGESKGEDEDKPSVRVRVSSSCSKSSTSDLASERSEVRAHAD